MATYSCSCLENPRDRGAWWAAIYGVSQSWTRLKQLSSSSGSSSSRWLECWIWWILGGWAGQGWPVCLAPISPLGHVGATILWLRGGHFPLL